MTLRVGMYADVALIEMGNDRFRQRAGMLTVVDKRRVNRLFADQNGDAGTLGFIILSRDIQDIGPDDGAGL